MDYIEESKIPPKQKGMVSSPSKLLNHLKPLIGTKLQLTGKSKTDGSNFRKIVVNQLLGAYRPEASDEYEIVPLKGKGVPSFLREYIDTYLVTTGTSYNLQVWNRVPNSDARLVDLKNGETLLACEVRFVLGKVDSDGTIDAIVVMTPDYIEDKFGKFGKPTVKQQLIISNKQREDIIAAGGMIIEDKSLPKEIFAENNVSISKKISIKDQPDKVLSIEAINNRVSDKLMDTTLDTSLSTKQRGQQLERIIAYQLGYRNFQNGLEGGYPDIRNQMLEVKVQDSPTVDLGRYSPQYEEEIDAVFTTRMVRYLIALTDADSGSIESFILCPGEELGRYFTYVAEESFKCQRSIPMEFFERFKGQVVFNP